jgi:hypothetical protein
MDKATESESVTKENPKDFIMVNRVQSEQSEPVPGRKIEENVCR